MATEKQTFGLDSFLPRTYRTKAEAFARSLHDKLRSLGTDGEDRTATAATVTTAEDTRNCENLENKESLDFSENIFIQNSNFCSKNYNNNTESYRAAKRERKNRKNQRKKLLNGCEKLGSSSNSEEENEREEKNVALSNGIEQTTWSKNKLDKTNSEESTHSTSSWFSCEDEGKIKEQIEGDDEEEVNDLMFQVKGSPGIKKYKRIKGRRNEVVAQEVVKPPPDIETEDYYDFDIECFSPENEREQEAEDDSKVENEIINIVDNYEVPHRILRGSSSAGNLTSYLTTADKKLLNQENDFFNFENSRDVVHVLSSDCLRLSTTPENTNVLTPPPSPASKRNSQDLPLSGLEQDLLRVAGCSYHGDNEQVQETVDEEEPMCWVEDVMNLLTIEVEEEEGEDKIEDERKRVVDEEETETQEEEVKDTGQEQCNVTNEETSTEMSEDGGCSQYQTIDTEEEIKIAIASVPETDERSENVCDRTEEEARVAPTITLTNYSDDIDDFLEVSPRIKLRRCSSLKSWKTPPGTPGRKKIVRFADALGLDLADVRMFLDEVPKIPVSAYEDLNYEVPCMVDKPKVGSRTLIPLFQQPSGQGDFIRRIRDENVCLENAVLTDTSLLTVSGCVRVKNVDFHKIVHIRYTIDDWISYSDLQATYINNSCDGFSDKFQFTLYGHTLQVGQKLEFAVKYQCQGRQYWDNNHGKNYIFQCLPASQNAVELPDNWPIFY